MEWARGMMERLRLDDTAYFLYTGQEDVLMDGIRVRVHPSVRVICGKAFIGRERLISVEFHDGVEVINEEVFCRCTSLCKILIPPLHQGNQVWVTTLGVGVGIGVGVN